MGKWTGVAQLVRSEGHLRGGISPKGSSIESGTEVAFALVRVGDLLGADIGPRGRDGTEAGVGQSSGEQSGIRRAWSSTEVRSILVEI